MKKGFLAAGVIASLLVVSPAMAKPNDNGANVTKSDGCFLPLPPDENGVVTGFPDPGANAHYVETPSGNSHSHCHGQLPPLVPGPDQAIILEGFPCATTPPAGGVTTDSKAVITPSGRVNTNCHKKG